MKTAPPHMRDRCVQLKSMDTTKLILFLLILILLTYLTFLNFYLSKMGKNITAKRYYQDCKDIESFLKFKSIKIMKMKKSINFILIAILIFLFANCKTTFTISDEIKVLVQNMSTDEAVNKLSLMINDSSWGWVCNENNGFIDVTEKSISYGHFLLHEVMREHQFSYDKVTYEKIYKYSIIKYSGVKYIIIQDNRLRPISFDKELRKTPNFLRISIRDVSNREELNVSVPKTDHDLAIALFSKLIPNAKIQYIVTDIFGPRRVKK